LTGDYTLLIIGTTIGFGVLAAILLVPVYRFMLKEDDMLSRVTKEELDAEARRRDHLESD
jgi:hypothetical protein